MDAAALLDPEIAEALANVPRFDGFTTEDLPALRQARIDQLALVQLSDAVERRELRVPGPPGAPEVAVRVHRPKGAAGALPCLFHMHGGGYVMGTAAMDDLRFDRWCPALGCMGVSVEYRLAPETPYPGPLEDCYAALRWTWEHAGELGIDRARLGIGGASAGGGLAAALALLVRDRGEFPVAFQLLIYPMLDDRMLTVSSRWEVPIWTPRANEAGWRAYLGERYGREVPGYAAPARAGDLSGLPPAYVMVGALDGFLDEDVTYALRLLHAGVPTELRVYPGAPHGFDGLMPGTKLARKARREMEEWLAERFAGG